MTSTNERFWAKVDKSGDCWLWTGCVTNGYGEFWNGGSKLAHRFSWLLHGGEVPIEGWRSPSNPGGRMLDHICHKRSCVRPDHLRLVTHIENMQNRVGAAAHSKSGVRGVHWVPGRNGGGRWRVVVRHKGKAYSGGRFSNLADANTAAISLRTRLFG